MQSRRQVREEFSSLRQQVEQLAQQIATLQLLQQCPDPNLVDDEVDDSDLEGNPFVAPLDNPIFDVYDEDVATITTDPVFDEYDDENEPIVDSYVKEDAEITYEPIFDEYDDGDVKIEVQCEEEDLKITDELIFDLANIVEEEELVKVDIFSKELQDELQVNELEAVKFYSFNSIVAFVMDGYKGKIRGRILSNLGRMM
ncbi:hypothetical protein PTKIN_Ptkin13bG0023200 [Pterospermum kingtungense]